MADDTHLMDASELHEHRLLEQTWQPPRGFFRWFTHVHHHAIGRRFIITAFVFFLLGGILALLMRLQLARPEQTLLGPDLYNQVFTMHGSTMMFLFAVPVMEAMGVYLIPLMIGTRNVVFPRLNAFSYWIYLFGGIALYAFFVLNIGPDAGWTTYVPLAGPDYSPGKRIDIWQQLINFTELSALAASVELIVTIFKLRAPGMSLNRMPLYVWSMLVTSFMVIFAMPAVMMASLFTTLDRLVGTHFFNPAEGGDVLLWQHLFWFFGHPEVYIIFIPALGMVSSIVATFARRPVLGHLPMVLSLVATAFLGFGLWVHHMFATGLPKLGNSFFTAASMTIAIPSGIQIFCWIATIWAGKPVFKTPLLYVVGFVVIFVIGGLTGGMLHEGAGKLNFWLFFVGFNVAFFPMHILGLEGMPRRVYTYPMGMGWDGMNLTATLGALMIALSVLVFIGNVAWSLRRGVAAGDNPWGASTLEWATSSPPPVYNFAHTPFVQSREPLWELEGELP